MTKNTKPAPTESTVQERTFADQFGEGATQRHAEALKELQEVFRGIAPDQLSISAEQAREAFAKQAPKRRPDGLGTDLKGKHVVRDSVSFTLPCGTVITRH